jgi:hypothetical protein
MENQVDQRERLVNGLTNQMQKAADDLIGSLQDARIEAAQRLAKMRNEEPPEMIDSVPEAAPAPTPEPISASTHAQEAPPQALKTRPLIFFHYPVAGYEDFPAWIKPLREALIMAGYMVYLPEVSLSSQMSEQDLPYLNSLPKRLVPALCRALKLPEEIGMLFDHPTTMSQMKNSESNLDSEATVFKDLWFLSRAAIVLVDLVRDSRGVGFGQKMLYAKILDIPIIGISPVGGVLNPWVQRSLSVLFTDQFNLNNIMPLIRGYAPVS